MNNTSSKMSETDAHSLQSVRCRAGQRVSQGIPPTFSVDIINTLHILTKQEKSRRYGVTFCFIGDLV